MLMANSTFLNARKATKTLDVQNVFRFFNLSFG